MREGYCVTITHLGEPILTIEHSMMSGKAELSSEDVEAIRDAGEHMIFLAGRKTYRCFVCNGESRHEADCPIAR